MITTIDLVKLATDSAATRKLVDDITLSAGIYQHNTGYSFVSKTDVATSAEPGSVFWFFYPVKDRDTAEAEDENQLFWGDASLRFKMNEFSGDIEVRVSLWTLNLVEVDVFRQSNVNGPLEKGQVYTVDIPTMLWSMVSFECNTNASVNLNVSLIRNGLYITR